jgi:hypothetical protein
MWAIDWLSICALDDEILKDVNFITIWYLDILLFVVCRCCAFFLLLMFRGASSQVFLAQNKASKLFVAVKIIPKKILINNKELAREVCLFVFFFHFPFCCCFFSHF